MNIVFVRHGRICISKQRRYIGREDVRLLPEGFDDIKKLKNYIECISFGTVYSSPLLRAKQSAAILSDKYITDERLMKANFGIFEGKTYEEICSKFPVECEKWANDYVNYNIPEGESLSVLFDRVENFLDDISKKDGNILAVTHEGVIRCALSLAVGNRDCFFKFRTGYGRVSGGSIDNGYMYIRAVNGLFNLKEIL